MIIEVILGSGLVLLSLLGGVIVSSLMGGFLRIERLEHRDRLAESTPGGQEDRWHLTSIGRERTPRFAPRHLQPSDLAKVWPIIAFAFVVLMPFATWFSVFSDDLMFALHPVVCVGWWLSMRSRGIIHAEVYVLSVWILAYTAWSLSMLALFERSEWQELNALNGDFASFAADQFGITSDLALTLWLLYVASGIVCVLAGIILARADRPLLPPLLAVALWIPLVWVHAHTNIYFGFLGLVMLVGVAGYGISREVRRRQDDAEFRAGSAVPDTRTTLRWDMSDRLILRTAAVVVAAVAISISAREFGMSTPGAELAATWLALLFAPSFAALLARFDRRPRVAAAWVAGAWLATVSVLALYHMIGPSSMWFSLLTQRSEFDQLDIGVVIHPQAIAVWVVAAVGFVMAYRKGKLMSYGALLLGLLWFPIATFAVGLRLDPSQAHQLPDAVSYANMVAMACVLLVIMWHFFGPGATTSVTVEPSDAVADDEPDETKPPEHAVHQSPAGQPRWEHSEEEPVSEQPPDSVPAA